MALQICHGELRQAWQHVCRLILDRAPVTAITRQLERALFLDGKMKLRRRA
jgi:hypothetical protein